MQKSNIICIQNRFRLHLAKESQCIDESFFLHSLRLAPRIPSVAFKIVLIYDATTAKFHQVLLSPFFQRSKKKNYPVCQAFTRPTISCRAANDASPVQLTGFLFDGCKGMFACLWPAGRYELRHPSFLMHSRQNGAEISDVAPPKTWTALILHRRCLFAHVISDSGPATRPPLQTLHIDSLVIIYRAGRRVRRASSQVLLSIMDG